MSHDDFKYGDMARGRSTAPTATEAFNLYGGIDWGVGQSPDFGLGYSRGLWHGICWALGIEAVIAGLVVLIVKVV